MNAPHGTDRDRVQACRAVLPGACQVIAGIGFNLRFAPLDGQSDCASALRPASKDRVPGGPRFSHAAQDLLLDGADDLARSVEAGMGHLVG